MDAYLFFFFFFQAEDGIRDLYVTGVQTCALPILAGWIRRVVRFSDRRESGDQRIRLPRPDEPVGLLRIPAPDLRVEHRRAEQRVQVCRCAFRQAVLIDAIGADLDPEPGGGR